MNRFRDGAVMPPWVAVTAIQFGLGAALAAASAVVPLTLTDTAGLARSNAPVTSGVPFPMGLLPTNRTVALTDDQGKAVPLQTQIAATWRDGSVKWLLLDFPATVPANRSRIFHLDCSGQSVAAANPVPAVAVTHTAEAVTVDTGPLLFSVARHSFDLFVRGNLLTTRAGAGADSRALVLHHLAPSLELAREFTNLTPRLQPPDEVAVEEPGPVRAVVRLAGWIDDGVTNRLLRYLTRVHAFAGSPAVLVQHTLVQMSPRLKMLWVKDVSLRGFTVFRDPPRFVLGVSPQPLEGVVARDASVALAQLRENAFAVRLPDGSTNSGFHAAGWIDLAGPEGGVLIVPRFFREQFPKALTVSGGQVRLGLYPAENPEPFDLDQGLAKTHEVWFDFHSGALTAAECAARAAARAQPLFAVAPPQWYCDSQVFGDLAPFDFDLFPDYETLTEASGDKLIKSMVPGVRHWGDFYYGGPYKGKNSFMDLEYDLPHNFLVQFARTGQLKYLEAARIMARHQADIDINHLTGWQWKHSPRHTETQAEFGHTFTRGLLETWFLTGDRRCREAALELGQFFAREIRNPRALGNERQIGWSLISLLPVYEATWDRRYFDPASETVERLMSGLDPRGKFAIRWDNRIAFFNGIAATGFIYFHRATGDERVAEAALRVIRRTLGMYPEYNGRTLEALAWAYQRTGDPNYLDALKRSFETTLARAISWNSLELGAPTIFTVHALPFMERSGLVSMPETPLHLSPAQFASENGFYAHHLPSGRGDLYFRVDSPAPFNLAVIRKGAWKAPGRAVLYTPSGEVMQSVDFPRIGMVWQRELLRAHPTTIGAYRLALDSPTLRNPRGGSLVTWDVASSRALPCVLQSAGNAGLEWVTPRLYTVPVAGASRIEITLTAEGEGFKKAELRDPDGHPAAVIEAFVDLGDQGRHHYTLQSKIDPRHRAGVWSLSLQDVSVSDLRGLAPCFATRPEAFFQPDKIRSDPRPR